MPSTRGSDVRVMSRARSVASPHPRRSRRHDEAEGALEEAARSRATARDETTLAGSRSPTCRPGAEKARLRTRAQSLGGGTRAVPGARRRAGIAWASYDLAFACYGQGRHEKALRVLAVRASCLAQLRRLDRGRCPSLDRIAGLLGASERPGGARGTLLGAADALVEQVWLRRSGVPGDELTPAYRAGYSRWPQSERYAAATPRLSHGTRRGGRATRSRP